MREILSEARHLDWPTKRTTVMTAGTVLLLTVSLCALVFSLDSLLTALLSGVSGSLEVTLWPFLVLWVLVTVRLVWVSRDHRGPGGDLAGVFNATAGSEWGGLTPSERRVGRSTAIWATVFVATTVLLSALVW